MKTEAIKVPCDEKFKTRLQEHCSSTGIPVAEFVRRLIHAFLTDFENRPNQPKKAARP